MVDVSNISPIALLEAFGKLRRGLNLSLVAELAPTGIGTKQAMFLRYLAKHESASQADLSRATLTDPAAVNRALDSLVQKGWVRRADDPKDRRRWSVHLTEEGAAVAKKVDRVFRKVADEAFSVLTPAARANLYEAFHTLIEKGLPEEIRKEIS